MCEKEQDKIKDIVNQFYHAVKDLYPVKKIILYGSHAKGNAAADSDIDVGVVIDCPDHLQRLKITADLFHHARKINNALEPKCIFWDEYQHHPQASILSEIIRSGIVMV